MFIVISPQNPDPMYKQVTDQIKDAIASGTLKPETKLPSIREMAQELKISMITIKRAYADLETKGYILTRSGLGSYVADINRDKLREEKLAEIRIEIKKILNAAARYDISADDIFSALCGKGVKE
jgi:GntR family transcriptional regulator